MTKIIEKGSINSSPLDQISIEVDDINIETLKITNSTGATQIIDLPDAYSIEKQQNGKYKITFNKDDDFQTNIGVMFYPFATTGGVPIIQDTQYHPGKVKVTYGNQQPLWGRIFNVKDLQ
jgi:hypothetical protein